MFPPILFSCTESTCAAMQMASLILKSIFLLSIIFPSTSLALNCNSAPYPDACFHSLKLSLALNLSPTSLTLLLQSLTAALSQGENLSNLLDNTDLVENQRGALQDCQELNQITLDSLRRSLSILNLLDLSKLNDLKAYLSAAQTNKVTCLEGLASASGSNKTPLLNAIESTYAQVDVALSILSRLLSGIGIGTGGGLTKHDEGEVLTVAQDGTGNFTLIQDAINFAPNKSADRTVIYVRKGVYQENVDIPSSKTNIMLIGDGRDKTVITGNRSVGSGWTTYRSATVAVSGEGFMARDIAFQNTAGPQNYQAVALRINADHAALYRCTMDGYQDTLYVHSFRQFYRECYIYGTIDYIFGNAVVIFQRCNIVSKLPRPGQFTVITAQSRLNEAQETGISIQKCSILATDELRANASTVGSYFGRPWQNYSRTVIMESYIEGIIEPEGWHIWAGDQGLATLYYGEYKNYGPGSSRDNRVTWPGYHVMDYDDASNFTVSQFIDGKEWLDPAYVPYEDGV